MRRLAPASLVLTAMILATPSPAAVFEALTTLGPIQTLSAAGGSAESPTIAVTPEGDAVFAWQRHDGTNWRVQTRTRSADGVLSGVETLSPPGVDGFAPHVAVNAAGNAVFMWFRGDKDADVSTIQALERSPDGVLSPRQSISPAGRIQSGTVAVDRQGNAVFAWSRFDGAHWQLEGRARSADGVLSEVQALSLPHADAFDPQIGIDSDGNAVVGWHNATAERILVRTRSADGALSPIQGISQVGKRARSHHFAVTKSGHAVFTWLQYDEASGESNEWDVFLRVRYADGTRSPVQQVSPSRHFGAESPRVAVDRHGNAVLAWVREIVEECRVEDCPFNRVGVIQARARSTDGVLGTHRLITGPHETVPAFTGKVHVAVDATGNAVFTWSSLFGVRARRRAADGILSQVVTLGSGGRGTGNLQVAVDRSGNAVFTWMQRGETENRIRARVWSAP